MANQYGFAVNQEMYTLFDGDVIPCIIEKVLPDDSFLVTIDSPYSQVKIYGWNLYETEDEALEALYHPDYSKERE